MFEIGQKVVPISKTTARWSGLENSTNWNTARSRGQNFLYFKGREMVAGEEVYTCGLNKNDGNGDFFRLSDLVPYVEEEKKSTLNLYYVIKCNVTGANSRFDSESKAFTSHPLEKEIENYMNEMTDKGFEVHYAYVEKRYRLES